MCFVCQVNRTTALSNLTLNKLTTFPPLLFTKDKIEIKRNAYKKKNDGKYPQK